VHRSDFPNLRGMQAENILTGPGITNWTFPSSRKPHQAYLGDFNVQFRAEIFNILNHATLLLHYSDIPNLLSDGTQPSRRVAHQGRRSRSARFNLQSNHLLISDDR